MFHGRGSFVDVLLNLLLHLDFHLLSNAFAMLDTHLNDLKGIPNQASLDCSINRSVGSKRRCVIDLKHPGFQLLVEHDIEAQKFEATVWLLRLTAPIYVLQLWLYRYYRLHHDRLNLVPDLSSGLCDPRFAFLRRWLAHDSFQAVVETQLVGIVIEVFILLVQAVVGQVRVWVVEVLACVILFGGEAH